MIINKKLIVLMALTTFVATSMLGCSVNSATKKLKKQQGSTFYDSSFDENF